MKKKKPIITLPKNENFLRSPKFLNIQSCVIKQQNSKKKNINF
jgi:hypothetical protein